MSSLVTTLTEFLSSILRTNITNLKLLYLQKLMVKRKDGEKYLQLCQFNSPSEERFHQDLQLASILFLPYSISSFPHHVVINL